MSQNGQIYLKNLAAKKETPAQVFSYEYCKMFKNTYFEEHLRTAASGNVCSFFAMIFDMFVLVIVHK